MAIAVCRHCGSELIASVVGRSNGNKKLRYSCCVCEFRVQRKFLDRCRRREEASGRETG